MVALQFCFSCRQARAGALSKQVSDIHEQVEQTEVERKTFQRLQEMEHCAVPKRLEVSCPAMLTVLGLCCEWSGSLPLQHLKEEVSRQAERENQLQVQYSNFHQERSVLLAQLGEGPTHSN